MRILPLLAALCATFPVEAANLRPVTTLHGPNVFLRDLFDDAGTQADRLLGPGPGPGGRIVVGAPQLAAIARQFSVEWRPASNGDRAVLEWPGRPLPRDDALAAVRAALLAAGTAADCLIELPGFVPPMVPTEAEPKPIVSQLDYDPDSGRFTATLSITGTGMEPITARIGGHVDDTVALPVPTMRLVAGTVLRPEDVHMSRVRTAVVRGEVIHWLDQAIGMQVKRQIPAGQPLGVGDLSRPTSVARGASVMMQLEAGGLAVSGQGIALEAGATGERIRVQNTASRAVIQAEVIGPGRVRVTPSTGAVLVGMRDSQGVLQ
jgi:flagella basal body P-ring formation protein FlgA